MSMSVVRWEECALVSTVCMRQQRESSNGVELETISRTKMEKAGVSQHNGKEWNDSSLDDVTLIRNALSLQRWLQACGLSLLLTFQLFNCSTHRTCIVIVTILWYAWKWSGIWREKDLGDFKNLAGKSLDVRGPKKVCLTMRGRFWSSEFGRSGKCKVCPSFPENSSRSDGQTVLVQILHENLWTSHVQRRPSNLVGRTYNGDWRTHNGDLNIKVNN